MVKVAIADNQTLTREGLKIVLSEVKDIQVIGYAKDVLQLNNLIEVSHPHVVIIDHDCSEHFSTDDVKQIHAQFPLTRLLILTNAPKGDEILDLMGVGINNHLFKTCGTDELLAAIYATAKGEEFFCTDTVKLVGGTLQTLNNQPVLSIRETEIIQLITAGMTNKEIAEKLYLSVHTIKTHRKNIIKKLGFTFKNAADLVIYATKTA